MDEDAGFPILFPGWVTSTECYWVTSREQRRCAETRVLAAHKLAMIDEKLAELGAMRKGLAALVAKCDSGANRSCPIIKVLVDD